MANVALLATIADAKASQATQTVSPVMPTGVILPYGGNTAPSGWLVCDGAEYSQTTYADLFAALGSTYNTQLNPVTGVSWAAPSGGNFRVPDMRGMFMRGEGTPSGLDTVSVGGSQVQKTKPNGVTASSATIGGSDGTHTHTASSSSSSSSSQDSHNHGMLIGYGYDYAWEGVGSRGHGGNDYIDFAIGRGSGSGYSGPYTFTSGGPSAAGVYTSTSTSTTVATTNSGHGHGAPVITISSTDNETRPINRGVKYIIKV